ncbi:recombination regulator RecX [Streptococcus anginosus]|uniref:Regulatory protein RecX n=1 Tax=Streptococcus anginosus subsp. whileyi CCUG 39159 TaxID=1095729 RepID=I0SDJ7_STRAP|nr:recombination regulator RecX [Streptococcus anginosus]AGU82902.1 recombination regulator RecX [Streptococcus anginosus C238]EID21450.1 regulatory protein RecX [Streptococcus anginosus subsp. whileyi CCUG 39159]MDB8661258.1 recombination regulator RecX [Streptococcus anginosus]MDP1385159.1 recombination regulator RecX [Streptococcus anginosus]QQT09192.1 recombination regulator RecX [Streptococcus anginosus]
MKITKIEKKKRLYLLELDETEKLYITEDTIVHFMLSKGMNITEQELKKIQEYAQFSYGKNLALYHLSFKQRTVKEVNDYLRKHDMEEETIVHVIDNLKKDNWLDDAKYAHAVINANLLSGDKGAYALKQKLMQKGIAASIIDDELHQHDFTNLAETVAQKLLKKYQGKLPTKALHDKILQQLINKGFSYEESKVAYQNLTIEDDDGNQQELLYKELDKQYRKYSKKYDGYDLKQRLTQALARKGYDFSDIASALREYL